MKMTDERFDKLLSVMLEMKEKQEEMQKDITGIKQDIAEIRQELSNTNDKIDNLGRDINLLAQKQWESERSINRLQKIIL